MTGTVRVTLSEREIEALIDAALFVLTDDWEQDSHGVVEREDVERALARLNAAQRRNRK